MKMKRQKNTRKEDRNLTTFTLFNHHRALERDRQSLTTALLISFKDLANKLI